MRFGHRRADDQNRVRIDEILLRRRGFWSLVGVRYMPIPFAVVNYGAAMAGLHFSTFLLTTLLGLIPALIVYSYFAATVAQPWHVVGESMEPVIQDGSVLLVDSFGPGVTGYDHGDIVVLSIPAAAQRGYPVLVKRSIGLPGDRVSLGDGGLALNGRPVAEPYLAAGEVQVQALASVLWENAIKPTSHWS